jgi:omega-6 fatty acid desaturase (delta-12 desaturase)
MLSGKELILATRPFAKEDRTKSWLYTLSTLFILLGLVLLTFWPPILAINICSSVLLGLVIVRMFVIYHDHQHHAILYKSKPANALMWLFGMLILAPPSIWKRSHNHHHNHNSKLASANIGSFPIVTKEKFNSMTRSERRMYLLTRHPMTILLGYFTVFIYGMSLGSFFSNPRKHVDSLFSVIMHGAMVALVIIFFGWFAWVLSMLIPFFIACAVGAYLFYAQHNFPGVKFSDTADWKYEIAALESSSYMKLNPFFRWVTANIGYHHIHHLNSRIPFYRLPEVMNHFKELQEVTITTLKPRDIIACFRLKVWDPEKNEMIPLK